MAGGGGTRLWPLSRSARPKPFLPLIDGRSLLRETVDRLTPLLAPADVHVVTDRRYVPFVRELLPELPEANVVAEPAARNTAAAVALAALAIERPPEEVMAVLPADHAIADGAGFRDALVVAAERAAGGDLVTLGVRPTGPATGYGYVLATGAPQVVAGRATYRVARFEEKPTPERAAELLASGSASWNAGIFVWRRDEVLAGLDRHARDILAPIRGGLSDPDALASAYRGLRATSIDYALLEPASLDGRVAVVPVDVGWSDLGSWTALRDALTAGTDEGNVLQADEDGSIIGIGLADVLVRASGGRLVAVVGLRDAIVVDTPDALLVCAADAAQDVRQVVDRLVAEDRHEQL